MARQRWEHDWVLLPCLTEKIKQKRANHEDLGKAAGVCSHTITRARQGKVIHRNLGVAIYDALNKNEFDRSNIGRW